MKLTNKIEPIREKKKLRKYLTAFFGACYTMAIVSKD